MRKKVQTPNPSTETKATRKKWYDEYFDFCSFRFKPISEIFLEKLGEDLVKYATAEHDDKKKEALSIFKFFKQKGIGSDNIKRWRERSEMFNGAYLFALEAIGERRELGAITKDYDSATVRVSMPKYEHKELNWTDAEEWRSKMRAAQDESLSGGTKIVVIEKYTEKEKHEL